MCTTTTICSGPLTRRRWAGLVTLAVAATASAGIFVETSPGTGSPGPVLGPYTMTPFPDDRRPVFVDVRDVPGPFGDDLVFAATHTHLEIGVGWPTWSHGYTGDVYYNQGAVVTEMIVPPGTAAFYFYMALNAFTTVDITATANDGTSATVAVTGSDAQYFGFYAIGGAELVSITVTDDSGGSAFGFAVGEFGIAPGPNMAPKWRQPPTPATPTDLYYGWNEASLFSDIGATVADDWVCSGSGPAVSIRWWGSFHNWKRGPEPPPPAEMPSHFHILFWTDVPAGVDEDFSHPGEVIHEVISPDFRYEFVGWDYDPRANEYEACFKFEQDFQPDDWFHQPSADAICWVSISACYDDVPPPEEHYWGWKTRPRDSASLAPDDAVVIRIPTMPGLGDRYADGSPIEFPSGVSWDMAFELFGPELAPIIKWSQPPAPYHPDDAFDGWNEDSVYGGLQIVADDWFCESQMPVTHIQWWGSFANWYRPSEPPQIPRAFHVGIWTDVPADPGDPDSFSHPGQLIWETTCRDYTLEFVGWDFDPRASPSPAQPPEACFKSECYLDPETWFHQAGAGSIYWLSLSAVYNLGIPPHVWGWTTRPRDASSSAPDDAVVIVDPTAPTLGAAYVDGRPIQSPLGVSWDTAFELTTLAMPRDAKWAQLPDLTENGVDIHLGEGVSALRILADDFLCTRSGLVTDVRLWGSWRNDQQGRLNRIQLSIHSNDPAGPGGSDPVNPFSKPDVLLWQRDYFASEFGAIPYAQSESGEWWWDPVTGELAEGGSRLVWMIDVEIDPDDAFRQDGTPDAPVVCWLGARMEAEEGDFGWKTRWWPVHFNDDAVWDYGNQPPRNWRELRYPPGHPHHWSVNNSIDLAFVVSASGERYLKWSQLPQGSEGFDAPSDLWWTDPSSDPNSVVGDDFYSDGRPVDAVRWWGSYIDPMYAPEARPVEPYVLDGWLISFHHDESDRPCPPDSSVTDIPSVLGVYFAPVDAVRILAVDMGDCFGHGIYEYRVDLDRCCLLCSEVDPRTGAMPAQPTAFAEEFSLRYWLGIQALVGVKWLPIADPCPRILTGHLPSPSMPDGHFWGWHTSRHLRLNLACTGRIVDFQPYPPDCWQYGEWSTQPWLCPGIPERPLPNMAFELVTLTRGPACPHADVNRDAVIDGFDIAIIRQGTNWLRTPDDAQVPLADVNGDYMIDGFDIAVIRSGVCWLSW